VVTCSAIAPQNKRRRKARNCDAFCRTIVEYDNAYLNDNGFDHRFGAFRKQRTLLGLWFSRGKTIDSAYIRQLKDKTMRSVNPRKGLRVAFIVSLIGFGLLSILGVAAGQDMPEAPSQSIYLPSIAGVSPNQSSAITYNFAFDSRSRAAWRLLRDAFVEYGISPTRQDSTIELAAEMHGAQHKIATIRCIGPSCDAGESSADHESGTHVQGPQDIELVVHLDEVRSIVFRPIASDNLEMDLMQDEELLQRINFRCQGCTIELTVDEHPGGPVPTPTPTETPISTVEPTPTETPDSSESPEPDPTATDDEVDNTPPVISDIDVVVSGKSALVKWMTNEPTTGSVDFGTTTSYELGKVNSNTLATSHVATLTGLTESTAYSYRITSADTGGNVASSSNATFTTSASGGTGLTTFLETFDGDPASPQPWTSSEWDITVHSRDRHTFLDLERMDAHHGSQCEPPLATHSISAYPDAVFQCKNHMMTAINAEGYGLIYLTPAYQVDFTDGTATIRFDMSTFRSSQRDWISIYISPMEDHLQLALEDWLPDLSGEPKRAVKVKMDIGNNQFFVEVVKGHNPSRVREHQRGSYEDFLTPSAATRTTFELQISRTHLKFGAPEYDFWWVDTDIEPLDWTVGVVQFGHHSYNPEKDFPSNCPSGSCTANTWHWDNISIEPAQPFMMIHADRRFADAASGAIVNFESPAPENAFLRFSGIGQNMEVSFDGGNTWKAAQIQPQTRHLEENFWSYFTPIPQGVASVQFRAGSWYGNPWHVRNLSIWAE
jgi:hypothetical protein